MSPIGGVGINLAIQDAVAAANILWQPLAAGTLRRDDLRRACSSGASFPTRVTQRLQVLVQNNVIGRALGARQDTAQRRCRCGSSSRFALLRRIPARLVGMGVRPEHVHTPDQRGLPTSG